MSAGSIVIDLLMKTGAFETDTKRAADIAKKRSQAMAEAFERMGRQIVTAGAVAGSALTAMVAQTNNNAKEITNLARISAASVEEFQKIAIAAKSVGVEQDQLGDMFKDFREKIGEFVATGGGEMKDFFDNVAKKAGVTADSFRNLSGPQALQLYFSSLEKAGVSTEQMSYYLESVGNDATKLIPLLRDGGRQFKSLGDSAEKTGQVMSEKLVADSLALSKNLDEMMGMITGLKNQIMSEMIPTLTHFSGKFLEVAKNAGTGKAALVTFGEAMASAFNVDELGDLQREALAAQLSVESLSRQLETAFDMPFGMGEGAAASIRAKLDAELRNVARINEQIKSLVGTGQGNSSPLPSPAPPPGMTPSNTSWVPKNEDAIKALEAAKTAMRSARAESMHLTQAQSALAEVMASKEWNGFSSALREQIKLAYNQADAIALSTQAASGLKVVQDMIRSAKSEADGLTQAQTAYADVMASIEWSRYNKNQQDGIRLAYEELDLIQQRTKAAKELKDAREQEFQSAFENISNLEKQIEDTQLAGIYKQKAPQAIEKLAISRLREKADTLGGFEGNQPQIDLINQEIAAREKLLNLQQANDADYWGNWLSAAEEAMTNFDKLAVSVVDNFSSGFGNAFEQMIFESQSLGDAISSLTEGMARAVVNALGQMAAQWVASELIKQLASEATTTAVVAGTAAQAAAGVAANAAAAASAAATGPAIAASMAPAAVTTSVATAGTNTLLAVAGIVAAMALIPKLAGARANGGPVAGGQTYLVGERGPELFTPNTSGAIIPNHALGGPAQGGGVTVNLIEDKSRAGQTQERNNNGAREIDVFVSDIMGDGPRSKAMAKAFGLQRRGY